MDLDFSFTLTTSVRSTAKQKQKTGLVSGYNKKLQLSSTRRKHCQGLFVKNEGGLLRSREESNTAVAAQPSLPVADTYDNCLHKIASNIGSREEVKENLDPAFSVMKVTDRASQGKSKSSISKHLNASCGSGKHDSSGEKDFIELAKVSLRKHQRSLYKRNIKDGKLFYKKNAIADFEEFVEKSFSFKSSDTRKSSIDVVNNGLRVSERLGIDDLGICVDNDDDDHLFGASPKSNRKNRNCDSLTGVRNSPLVDLIDNGLDQSLVVTSPSILNNSLLGCRPLPNVKKRNRCDSISLDPNSSDCSRPSKRSATLSSSGSRNNSQSIYFQSLKTNKKHIFDSSSSPCDVSSPFTLNPKSERSASINNSETTLDVDRLHGKTMTCTSQRETGLPEHSIPTVDLENNSKSVRSRRKKDSHENNFNKSEFKDCDSRKDNVSKYTSKTRVKSDDTNQTSVKKVVDRVGSEIKSLVIDSSSVCTAGVKIKKSTQWNRLNKNSYDSDDSAVLDRDSMHSIDSNSLTRAQRRSFKDVCVIDESCTSNDIFDDSRSSKPRHSEILPVPKIIETSCRATRASSDIKSVGECVNENEDLKGCNGNYVDLVSNKSERRKKSDRASSGIESARKCDKENGELKGCNRNDASLVSNQSARRVKSSKIDSVKPSKNNSLSVSRNEIQKKESLESYKTAEDFFHENVRLGVITNELSFEKPHSLSIQTFRRKSIRSNKNHVIDESCASKDMFESDDDHSKSGNLWSKIIEPVSKSIEVSSPVLSPKKRDSSKSEKVKSEKRKSSLTKDALNRKNSSNDVDTDDGAPYLTPSLPRTKFIEITKWLTESERSIRPGVASNLDAAELDGVQVLDSDSGEDCVDKKSGLKTPKSSSDKKTDTKHKRVTEEVKTKTKTKNRPANDKRSARKVKNEDSDKDDDVSCKTKTTSSSVDKFCGKQWPGATSVIHTEPKKPKVKEVDIIKPALTEKKRSKSSMFSSSSSSEDLFEKFLDDQKKKRLSRLRRVEKLKQLTMERFIYDGSSEEDESLAFYNDIIGSEVKKDVECLSEGKWSSHSGESGHVLRRPRRLSFESQSSGSDRGTIVGGRKEVTKKTTTSTSKKPKKRTPDKITKKHLPFRISPKHFLGSSKKSAKKPASVKKTHEDKAFEQIKRINDNNMKRLEPLTPLADKVGTKTPAKTPLTVGKAAGVATPASSKKKNEEIFLKTPAKNLSFLSSLSVTSDDQRCHPEAVQYKTKFKKLRVELAKKLFSLYNREVFNNMLPEDLPIEWNSRMTCTSGYCYNKKSIKSGEVIRTARIQLSPKVLDSADRVRDTLIHELCHAATWLVDGVIDDGHGRAWKRWTQEAMRRFPELPRITVCHSYKINKKYMYRCVGCGYSVGRHSKSLNIEHKRCGYCYGKFELVVNVKERADKKISDKESDSGTTSSTMRTPRAPTGFALFVKENYGKVKKANANLVHKDVMKELSQRFAEVKLAREASSALKQSTD